MTETRVPDDQNRRVVANFNALAETYDIVRLTQVCARRLVDLAALPPGAPVLDVATGTGWAALAAAQDVGPTGRVCGGEGAPEWRERARQKVAAAGLTPVECRAGDAQRLDLGDQSCDVVLGASARLCVPDMLAALREWHRVLHPGGQGGCGVWTDLPAVAGPLGGAPVAGGGVPAHGVAGRSPGRAGDVSAVTARGRRGADRGAERAIGRLLPDGGGVLGREGGGPAPHGRLPASPSPARAVSGRAAAEGGALATAQGRWRDVPVPVARGWKRPAEGEQPEGGAACVTSPAPNQGMQATAKRLRSSVAPARGGA